MGGCVAGSVGGLVGGWVVGCVGGLVGGCVAGSVAGVVTGSVVSSGTGSILGSVVKSVGASDADGSVASLEAVVLPTVSGAVSSVKPTQADKPIIRKLRIISAIIIFTNFIRVRSFQDFCICYHTLVKIVFQHGFSADICLLKIFLQGHLAIKIQLAAVAFGADLQFQI